jgi:hypothetical protein
MRWERKRERGVREGREIDRERERERGGGAVLCPAFEFDF